MIMKKNSIMLLTFILLLIVALLAPMTAGCTSEPTTAITVTWRAAGTPASASTKYYVEFQRRMTEATDGLMTFDMHYGAVLYKSIEAIEAVAAGDLGACSGAASYMDAWDPAWALFNIPFVFDDYDHIKRFNKSSAIKELSENLVDSGLRIMPNSLNSLIGSYLMYANFPVTKYEDFTGHDLRISKGGVMATVAELLGANGMVISTSELPVAVQSGMVDCLIGTQKRSWVESAGINQKMTHYLQPDFLNFAVWMFSSDKQYQSWPRSMQKTWDEVSVEWSDWLFDQEQVDIQASRQWLEQTFTVAQLSPTEMEKLRTKLAPVFDEYAKSSPMAPKLLKALEDTRK
jgi:C4-dicarboxylate-binding protein DctP